MFEEVIDGGVSITRESRFTLCRVGVVGQAAGSKIRAQAPIGGVMLNELIAVHELMNRASTIESGEASILRVIKPGSSCGIDLAFGYVG